ncbi:hypothetical protein NKR23_g151 [Pleurostoma richardsiae]|uniref:NAD(P)-binding protein n=1 Tax=Pleurostoma richardsiae TaxID=41990 RepID=A0AA38VX85_9PEZI|nr:hypothetical protein NKR23_g151 [Pleurostoma richardsiae]
MARNIVYLLTGANRGIGKGIVSEILLRPSVTVVATVRKPDAYGAALSALPTGAGSKIVMVGLDSANEAYSYESLPTRLAALGVDALDVVIANAGTSAGFKSIADTDPTDVLSDIEVNAVGPLRLFKTLRPLLIKNADGQKKFVVLGTAVATFNFLGAANFPSTGYGMSKVALHWFAAKAAVEFKSEGLKIGILHPGWVQTEFGQALADSVGVAGPPTTLEHSVKTTLQRIDELNEETSGKLFDNEGKLLPW